MTQRASRLKGNFHKFVNFIELAPAGLSVLVILMRSSFASIVVLAAAASATDKLPVAPSQLSQLLLCRRRWTVLLVIVVIVVDILCRLISSSSFWTLREKFSWARACLLMASTVTKSSSSSWSSPSTPSSSSSSSWSLMSSRLVGKFFLTSQLQKNHLLLKLVGAQLVMVRRNLHHGGNKC